MDQIVSLAGWRSYGALKEVYPLLIERHLYQVITSLAINWRYKMRMAS
jgi:hypothetical protein